MNITPAGITPPSSVTSRPGRPPSPRCRPSTGRSLLIALCLGACVLVSSVGAVIAAPPAQTARSTAPAVPPEWAQLSAEQREAVIAVVRDRWNANPGQRARMLEHARRWQAMTPEQRRQAERGLARWSHMSPEERAKVRERFHARGGGMTAEQRRTLRDTLREMTPEQRREWLRKKRAERHNTAPTDRPGTPNR